MSEVVKMSQVAGAAAVAAAKAVQENRSEAGAPVRQGVSTESLRPAPRVAGTSMANFASSEPGRSPTGQELQDRALTDNVADRWQRLHEGLARQAARLSEEISGGSHRVEVAMDGGSGRFVMKVVDSDSGLVVRQFPPESVLKVSERMDELSGMLLANEA